MATQWRDSFYIDNDKINAQHKELFRLANFVENLDPRSTTKLEISNLFKDFFTYMEEHFSEEEAYMESIDYPLLEQHRKLHQDIIDSIANILKQKKSIEELQQAMKEASHKWLVEHIINNDLKMEKWRLGNTVTSADMKKLR